MPMKAVINYLEPRKLGLAVALVLLAVDAATKWWALQTAAAGKFPIILHDNVMALTLAFNRGMSFSFLADGRWAPIQLSVIAVVASAWFIHWLGESRDRWHQVGLGMILSGAVGNLIDRLQHGAVVDFLLPIWNREPWFPAFNVADTCISAGLGVILMGWIVQMIREKKNSGTQSAKGKK
jgi:signal peptidase II